MLTHVDLAQHTVNFRCDHCHEHHTQIPVHPDAGHVTVRADDVYITCPSCRERAAQGQPCPMCQDTKLVVHGETVELFSFDHLTDVDAGWDEPAGSLVGTQLPGGNVVVLDDRWGVANPARRRQAQLILALLRHPHIVTARDVARKSQD